MCNAKQEFLSDTNNKKVVWAVIEYKPTFHKENNKLFTLKPGYSQSDYDVFLNELNFEYDDGYNTQHLFGYVLFDDDSWLERYEYDGSECWTYKFKPTFSDVIKEYGDYNG